MGELRAAKGICLSINKTVGRAGRTNSTIQKATKPKKETKSYLKNGEFCPNINIQILSISCLLLFFFTCVYL